MFFPPHLSALLSGAFVQQYPSAGKRGAHKCHNRTKYTPNVKLIPPHFHSSPEKSIIY